MSDEPKQRGRPTEYNPEFCQDAYDLCQQGATDFELAEEFGVDVRTIYRWKAKYPEFCQALKMGKESPDDRMEASLYHRGIGYSHRSVKFFVIDDKVIREEYIHHYPPETTAGIFWLKNRRPHLWRDTAMRDDSDANDVRIHGGLPKKPSDDDA